MFDLVMQFSAYLVAQGYSPHEQLLIGFAIGAMVVNPVAYALIRSTGLLGRIAAAPFEARANRVKEEKRKERKIAQLERKLDDLSTLWTNAQLEKMDLDEALPIMLLDDDDEFDGDDAKRGYDPFGLDGDSVMPPNPKEYKRYYDASGLDGDSGTPPIRRCGLKF